MPAKYDYILNRLRLKDGDVGLIKGSVDTYADLPAGALDGDMYYVTTGSGGFLASIGMYKYPKGFYVSDGADNWSIAIIQAQIAEDAVTLVSIADWINLLATGVNIGINDLINYNSVLYRNTTGVTTLTAPDTDTTNWVIHLHEEYDYYVRSGDWADLVQALESGTYATVFIPNGTYTCTDNEATPLAVHANVKRISGQSRNGVIIDSNCAVNTSIQNFITFGIDTELENITVNNFGTGVYSAFRGDKVAGEWSRIFNCGVYNILNNGANGFYYVHAQHCYVENPSSVGVAGIGRAFRECLVSNCTTYYTNYGTNACQKVSGSKFFEGTFGSNGSFAVSGNYMFNCAVGIDTCFGVSGNYISGAEYGIRYSYDVSKGNKITAAIPYYQNNFDNSVYDPTDNTKIATLDNSGQTTGTERIIDTPNWDYDMENPPVDSIVGRGLTSPAHAEGMQFYDTVNKCWTNYNDIVGVGLQVGYEDHERIYNDTGIEIPDATPYYYTGLVTDGYLHIAPADADASGINVKQRGVQGVTTHVVGIDSQGIGALRGYINDIDTTGTPYGEVWAVGDDIYAGITVGAKTNVRPLSPSSQFRLGKVVVAHATTGVLNLKIEDQSWLGMTQAANQAGERTGFVLSDGVAVDTAGNAITYAVDDVALEFTLGSVAGSFQFFSINNLFTKVGDQTVSWTDVEGDHFFYYDETGVLQHTTTFSDSFILGPNVFVAYLLWDAVNKEVILDNVIIETHGLQMDGASHLHFHETLGSQWKSGLSLNSILADESGALDTHAQFGCDSGIITDEDLWHSLSSVTSTTGLRIVYIEGSAGLVRQTTKAGFSVITDVDAGVGSTGRLVYNEWTGTTWQLTTVGNGQIVNCLIFSLGIGDAGHRIFAVVGSETYGNVADAEEGAKVELGRVAANLPFKERRPLGVVMLQTSLAYGNAVKARVVATDGGEDYIDVRTDALPGGVGFTPASHPSLADRDVAGAHPSTAISYDPTISELAATTVKEAIDELADDKGLTWTIITEDTLAVPNGGYFFDTRLNTIDLTLPATPAIDTRIGIRILYADNTSTVARNSVNIEGVAEDLIIDLPTSSFELVYSDATKGWVITTEVNGGGSVDIGLNNAYRAVGHLPLAGGSLTGALGINQADPATAGYTSYKDLVIGDLANAYTGITIQSNSAASIVFNNSDGGWDGGLSYDFSTDRLSFIALGGARATIDSSGLKLSTGATVDNIETTMTSDATHIPTSSAVINYYGWKLDETNGSSSETNENAITFAGKLNNLLDETQTVLCKFYITNSHGYMVNMDVFCQQRGTGNLTFGIAQKITFLYNTDGDGNTTISAVNVLSNQNVLDGFSSVTMSFAVAVNGNYVELKITQNNESYDSSGSITYVGNIIGGYDGGHTVNYRVAHD